MYNIYHINQILNKKYNVNVPTTTKICRKLQHHNNLNEHIMMTCLSLCDNLNITKGSLDMIRYVIPSMT